MNPLYLEAWHQKPGARERLRALVFGLDDADEALVGMDARTQAATALSQIDGRQAKWPAAHAQARELVGDIMGLGFQDPERLELGECSYLDLRARLNAWGMVGRGVVAPETFSVDETASWLAPREIVDDLGRTRLRMTLPQVGPPCDGARAATTGTVALAFLCKCLWVCPDRHRAMLAVHLAIRDFRLRS